LRASHAAGSAETTTAIPIATCVMSASTVPAISPSNTIAADGTPADSHITACATQRLQYGRSSACAVSLAIVRSG
jgi:hypothetical protein